MDKLKDGMVRQRSLLSENIKATLLPMTYTMLREGDEREGEGGMDERRDGHHLSNLVNSYKDSHYHIKCPFN